jgi:multidrug resistance efflux pump
MPDLPNRQLEAYSEEVAEIMGHIPRWIVRWGVTVFFIIFALMATGSYFFKYPVVVSVPFKLTTINPPAPLVCKSSGRIAKWYVSDGQLVQPNSLIALLENTAKYQDVKLLKDVLQAGFAGNQLENRDTMMLPIDPVLGSLQNTFVSFRKKHNELGNYLKQDINGKKIELTERKIINHRNQYALLLKQWKLKQQEFELARMVFIQDSTAYVKGGYGIIKTEYDRALQTIISQKSSLLSFEASVMNAEVALMQLEESHLELLAARENELNSLKNSLNAELVSLQSQIDEWFENYVITSPIEGKITLTNYWSENQVVNSGERLATIVPVEETIIIARAYIPATSLGKVIEGQRVNVKLSGFPHLEYGVLHGIVNNISMIPEEEGYVAAIKLDEGMQSSYNETLRFIQQMDGTADIITEDTRLIYRFINPLRSSLKK